MRSECAQLGCNWNSCALRFAVEGQRSSPASWLTIGNDLFVECRCSAAVLLFEIGLQGVLLSEGLKRRSLAVLLSHSTDIRE